MLISRNIKLGAPYKVISAWRKTSLGTWKDAREACIYSQIDIDASPLLAKIDSMKRKGSSITIPAIIGKAIANSIKHYPMLNSIIRFGKIYPRKEINIFFQAYYRNKEDEMDDLAGICIKNCDELSLREIAKQIQMTYLKIRRDLDPDTSKRGLYHWLIPNFFLRTFWNIMSFVLFTLNIKVAFQQADYFGSAMVTSLSAFNIENAFVPLLPFTHCPVIVAVGSICKKALVQNDEIVIKPVISLCISLDHRLIDGAGAGEILKRLKAYLENPE